MAKASIDTVTKTVTEQVDEEVIQLTLSKVEARALYALAALVYSYDGDDTYKREAYAVKSALWGSGRIGYDVYSDDYFYVDADGDLRGKAHKSGDK